jgi:hypothetical protein
VKATIPDATVFTDWGFNSEVTRANGIPVLGRHLWADTETVGPKAAALNTRPAAPYARPAAPCPASCPLRPTDCGLTEPGTRRTGLAPDWNGPDGAAGLAPAPTDNAPCE